MIAIFYAYTKHMEAGEARPNDTLVVHDTSWIKHDSIIEKTKIAYKEVIVNVMSSIFLSIGAIAWVAAVIEAVSTSVPAPPST